LFISRSHDYAESAAVRNPVVDVPDLTVPGARAQPLTDAGSADLYGDGTEAKDLDHAEWKKSRSVWFTVSS
jgi:hypothetical protein